MSPASNARSSRTISINRAPVLTLWAAIVAERLGYDRAAATTFGKTVAGLNAATKAQRLGLTTPGTKKHHPKSTPRPSGKAGEVELLGRTFPTVETDDGVRALHDGKPVSPESVERYLEAKFGARLSAARAAMTALARSRPPRRLAEEAFALYEAFRPEIPRGTRGWGAKGLLDLDRIAALTKAE